MKLSELSTDRALDVLCEMTPFVSGILTDEELLAELRDAVDLPQEATLAATLAIGGEKLSRLTPIFLKKRRADIFGLLAALEGKTLGEIAGQPFLTTAAQLRDVLGDKELLDFFKSFGAGEPTGPSSP